MMMSDEHLQNLLSQNDPRFAQEQPIPTTIDEEELEDDDAEEDAGGDGTHGTPDDEQDLEDEGGSTQTEYSLGTSGGYGSLTRHLKSAHLVEYAKIDKGKGKQTQISRF
ncbi:unnamed protein product [Cuscuta epithymum]|uniref:Uncharacterized protein n=1 Tax=Cuscuta epithymum TaxID=186058 RepID=A0AAV0EMV0_9ASTE|nr:unnamed protein product [Cuscuta epithymum]